MPRRSAESAIALAICRFARRKAALEAVAFEADRRLERERPGAVLVGAGSPAMKVWMVSTRAARRPHRRRGRPCVATMKRPRSGRVQ